VLQNVSDKTRIIICYNQRNQALDKMDREKMFGCMSETERNKQMAEKEGRRDILENKKQGEDGKERR
jgi:hypothetical protein